MKTNFKMKDVVTISLLTALYMVFYMIAMAGSVRAACRCGDYFSFQKSRQDVAVYADDRYFDGNILAAGRRISSVGNQFAGYGGGG